MSTIQETYDELKTFLLPGVYNLTNDDLNYALGLLGKLIKAVSSVSVSFDLEDDRRVFLNQLKIMQRSLQDIAEPVDPRIIQTLEHSNLYRIALDELGDALRWAEILSLNNLTEPFLTEAMSLKLPQ